MTFPKIVVDGRDITQVHPDYQNNTAVVLPFAGRRRSPWWATYHYMQDNEGRHKGICNICAKVLSLSGGGGTSSLARHLKSHRKAFKAIVEHFALDEADYQVVKEFVSSTNQSNPTAVKESLAIRDAKIEEFQQACANSLSYSKNASTVNALDGANSNESNASLCVPNIDQEMNQESIVGTFVDNNGLGIGSGDTNTTTPATATQPRRTLPIDTASTPVSTFSRNVALPMKRSPSSANNSGPIKRNRQSFEMQRYQQKKQTENQTLRTTALWLIDGPCSSLLSNNTSSTSLALYENLMARVVETQRKKGTFVFAPKALKDQVQYLAKQVRSQVYHDVQVAAKSGEHIVLAVDCCLFNESNSGSSGANTAYITLTAYWIDSTAFQLQCNVLYARSIPYSADQHEDAFMLHYVLAEMKTLVEETLDLSEQLKMIVTNDENSPIRSWASQVAQECQQADYMQDLDYLLESVANVAIEAVKQNSLAPPPPLGQQQGSDDNTEVASVVEDTEVASVVEDTAAQNGDADNDMEMLNQTLEQQLAPLPPAQPLQEQEPHEQQEPERPESNLNALEKMQGLVKFFTTFEKEQEMLRQIQTGNDINKTAILMEQHVTSSWWSTLQSIERFLDLRETLIKYEMNKNGTKGYYPKTLDNSDWISLTNLQALLKPLKLAQQAFTGQPIESITPTSTLIPFIVYCVYCELDKLSKVPTTVQTADTVATVAKQMISQFRRVFGDKIHEAPYEVNSGLKPEFLYAHVLDPRFKTLKIISNRKNKEALWDGLLEEMVKLGPGGGSDEDETQVDSQQLNNNASSTPVKKDQGDGVGNDTSVLSVFGNDTVMAHYAALYDLEDRTKLESSEAEQPKTWRHLCQAELQQYRAEVVAVQLPLLEWWKVYATRFPTLWRLACRYFAVPALAAPPARAYKLNEYTSLKYRCQSLSASPSIQADGHLIQENLWMFSNDFTEASDS